MVKYLNFKVFQAEQGGQAHHYGLYSSVEALNM